MCVCRDVMRLICDVIKRIEIVCVEDGATDLRPLALSRVALRLDSAQEKTVAWILNGVNVA